MAGKDVLPRARQDGLVIRELADETLVYDLERHQAHCLNKTAALIWNHCDGRTSSTEMRQILEKKFKTSFDDRVVYYAIDRLGKSHLLEGRQIQTHSVSHSRRELLGGLGRAALLAIPVILSISAPTPAVAASCTITPSNCNASTNGCKCTNGRTCNGTACV